MKKIYMILFLILWGYKLLAQTISTSPEVFSAEDEVTFTFDVTGNAQLQALTEAYVWVWKESPSPIKDAPTNVSPATASQSAAKATKISNTKWEIKFIPSTFIGVASNDITKMGIILKGKDWSNGQTGNFILDVAPPGFYVLFDTPSSSSDFVEINKDYAVSAITNENSTIKLFLNNVEIQSVTDAKTISATIQISNTGSNSLKVTANNGTETKEATATLTGYSTKTASLPAGIRLGINYHSDQTKATLCLAAPDKKFAYLIGDFNNWTTSEAYQMNQTPDGEYFWYELTGLIAKKEYIFQYFVDGKIKVGDPYADKVSDPFDDKFIDAATYPNLIQYPEGKTDNRATVLQTGQDKYVWKVTNFQAPAKEKLVIYEMLIRDWTAEHTYKVVKDSLSYLKKLGINALQLMPVMEFEGNKSWGYNPNFFFAPDKYYGTKNDLKALIDACHENGIAVILDIVLNHAYGSCPLVGLYPSASNQYYPGTGNPWFNLTDNIPALSFGPDFNHESTYTQSFIDSVNAYWMKEYNVDGYRFDFTKGFGNNFKGNSDPFASLYDADRVRLLKRMVDEIRKRKSNAYIIFEHLAENKEEKELVEYGIMMWGNINHDYRENAKGINKNISWAVHKERGWTQPNLISYMESHDEQRVMWDIFVSNSGPKFALGVALERIKLSAAFSLTLPGPRMIWQFGEFGYDVSIDENGRTGEKPLKWDYYKDANRLKLFKVYSELNKLKQYPVFSTNDMSYSLTNLVKRINLNHLEMNVSIIGNFGLQDANVEPKFQKTGTWYDFFTGEAFGVSNANMTFKLAAGQFHILVDKPITFPEKGLVLYELIKRTPTVLSAIPVEDGTSVTIKWTDISFDEEGFVIERSDAANGNYTEVGTVGANTTEFIENTTTLEKGKPYYYKVSATFGGKKFTSREVETSSPLSAEEDLVRKSITVYPNPSANGKVNLTFEDVRPEYVKVLDLTGKELMFKSLENVNNVTETLELGHLGAGMYVLQIKANGVTVAKKVIIQ
jgi:glycosidase